MARYDLNDPEIIADALEEIRAEEECVCERGPVQAYDMCELCIEDRMVMERNREDWDMEIA